MLFIGVSYQLYRLIGMDNYEILFCESPFIFYYVRMAPFG